MEWNCRSATSNLHNNRPVTIAITVFYQSLPTSHSTIANKNLYIITGSACHSGLAIRHLTVVWEKQGLVKWVSAVMQKNPRFAKIYKLTSSNILQPQKSVTATKPFWHNSPKNPMILRVSNDAWLPFSFEAIFTVWHNLMIQRKQYQYCWHSFNSFWFAMAAIIKRAHNP